MFNADTNETLVYAIGDQFMGARIYAIDKTRVFINHDGKNEYIDNVGITRSPATYNQVSYGAALQEVEPITPQG